MISFAPPATSILRLVDLLSLPRHSQTFSLWSLGSLSQTHPTTFTHAPCPAHRTQKFLRKQETLPRAYHVTWPQGPWDLGLHTIRCFKTVVLINLCSSLHRGQTECTLRTVKVVIGSGKGTPHRSIACRSSLHHFLSFTTSATPIRLEQW